MLETLSSCPICQHTIFRPFLVCEDYTVSHEKFQIVECQGCQFKFTNPRPNARNIGKYYQSEEYISHSNTQTGLVNKIYHQVRKQALKTKLKLIETYHSKGRLLDYGCGTGSFLEVCQKAGWQISGIEPDDSARKKAELLTNSSIESDIFTPQWANQTFDIITLWHVLEHIHSLEQTLLRLKNLLHPQGTMLIAVPNCASWDARYFQQYWAAYDVPRHLYHFTPETMERLLVSFGLVAEQRFQMPYDAYYISLLSNKYKQGKTNFPKAILQGFQSNRWAKKHQTNYSSVLYVVKHLTI